MAPVALMVIVRVTVQLPIV
jgi:hypothetical protein